MNFYKKNRYTPFYFTFLWLVYNMGFFTPCYSTRDNMVCHTTHDYPPCVRTVKNAAYLYAEYEEACKEFTIRIEKIRYNTPYFIACFLQYTLQSLHLLLQQCSQHKQKNQIILSYTGFFDSIIDACDRIILNIEEKFQ